MDEPVARGDDLPPWNLRVRSAYRFGDVRGGLADKSLFG